jgi:hypothetical protein
MSCTFGSGSYRCSEEAVPALNRCLMHVEPGSMHKVVKRLKLAESRLEEVRGTIALFASTWLKGQGMKLYDLESLAEDVDPSPMKRGGWEAFIKKNQNWVDEDYADD